MLVMGKSLLPDDVNQSLLFPPLLNDSLPERHLARLPALQPARPAGCSPRVEAGVLDLQPAQAVRFRMDPA
jgi:hypothetical protein